MALPYEDFTTAAKKHLGFFFCGPERLSAECNICSSSASCSIGSFFAFPSEGLVSWRIAFDGGGEKNSLHPAEVIDEFPPLFSGETRRTKLLTQERGRKGLNLEA